MNEFAEVHRCLLESWGFLTGTRGCFQLPATCLSPASPTLRFLIVRAPCWDLLLAPQCQRHRSPPSAASPFPPSVPPQAPARPAHMASFCSPISISGEPAWPGPPACLAQPLKP